MRRNPVQSTPPHLGHESASWCTMIDKLYIIEWKYMRCRIARSTLAVMVILGWHTAILNVNQCVIRLVQVWTQVIHVNLIEIESCNSSEAWTTTNYNHLCSLVVVRVHARSWWSPVISKKGHKQPEGDRAKAARHTLWFDSLHLIKLKSSPNSPRVAVFALDLMWFGMALPRSSRSWWKLWRWTFENALHFVWQAY